MSWCSDAPEDEAISLFAGLLVNPDMTLRQGQYYSQLYHEECGEPAPMEPDPTRWLDIPQVQCLHNVDLGF